MSPVVEIIGVGAYIVPADSDRPRAYVRGDRLVLSDEDAAGYAAAGVVRVADQDTVAEHAEAEQPDGGVIFDPDWSLPVMRKFADQRRITLRDARSKAMVTEDIEAALTDPDSEDGDG
jgi:hypothetical protein